MPKTITIGNVDEDLYRRLTEIAAQEGITAPELLRREVRKLVVEYVPKPSIEEWLERTRRVSSGITREEVLAAFDEMRGP